ncbi:MAG: YegS/Rv2252/BmrU family lipid kinase [Planctomycetes bacterium]|nr:YegS/Rv2252/BmrU family lipid kinase [Planctomycetota bacterium]
MPAPHLQSVVLIANPRAGGGRGEAAARTAEAALEAHGVRPRLERTTGPGDAARLAAAAARDGATLVVAVGGDGTLHEALDGLLDGDDRPALGVIPVGGGNDYARLLGVAGLDAAAAARALVEGAPRPVDVARMDGGDRGAEHVLNNVGLGFAALANATRERARWLGGPLSYLVGGVLAVATFRPDPLVVAVDEVSIEGRFLLGHLAVGRYCGAGIDFTPQARHDDGLIDVALVTERTRLRAIAEWPRLTRGAQREDVAFLRGRRVRVFGPRGLLLHVDGEVRRVPLGVLELRVLPGAVRVVHAPGARP